MNKKAKILITEDDVLISEQLNDILLDLGYEVTAIAEDAESAIDSLKENCPDIAILDIKMHGSDQGFEIAQYIKDSLDIPYVFLTAFTDTKTVENACHLQPSAYLVKPFNKHDIFSTLEVALNNYQSKNNTIVVKDGYLNIKLKISDILWIKSDHVYIEVQTKTKKYILRSNIDKFLSDYNLSKIRRAHRSYAINIDNVKVLKSNYALIDNQKIPVSRKYRDEVSEMFLN